MEFIWVQNLWFLLLIPVLIVAYIIAQRRRQKYAVRYASLSLVKEALGRGPGIRRHIPPILFIIALAVLIFALARPAAVVTIASQQGTVILTFDVSGSMAAEDVRPTRLEGAKAAARTFIDHQPESVQIGVVSFSDNAFIVQAPTNDHQAVLAAINRLQPQRGTAIGRGILTSLDAIFEPTQAANNQNQFQNQFAFGSNSYGLDSPTPMPSPTPVPKGTYAPAIVVLLSDGESNVGPAPLDVVNQATDRGVRIYTVGLGNPAGTIIKIQGRSIRVSLDEPTLQSIADKTEARYYRADTDTDLNTIYDNLSKQLVFKPEKTEITFIFTAIGAGFALIAGALSLLWFNRLP